MKTLRESKIKRMIARYRARGMWEPIGLHDRALPGTVVEYGGMCDAVCGDANRCCDHPSCRSRCNLVHGCGRGCKASVPEF